MDKNPAVVNQYPRYFDAEKPANKSHLLESHHKIKVASETIIGHFSQFGFLTTDIIQPRPFLWLIWC